MGEETSRFLCSASHVEHVRAFYNGKKSERHKTRVTGRKEKRGRQAGKKKKSTLISDASTAVYFKSELESPIRGGKKSLLSTTSPTQMDFSLTRWKGECQSHG